MSKNKCQEKATLLPTTTGNDNKSNSEAEFLAYAPLFAYVNLTISSIGTTYRAYANNDMAMVAFIIFVILGYFVLEICFRALKRLPRDEESAKKSLLKFTIWGLSSSILFGFAYQLGTFACLGATLIMYAVVIASSSCIFFVYFIHDDKKNGATVSADGGEKIGTDSWSSCDLEKNDDKKTAAVFEKV
ncbi:hypothetical protein TIFTF001_011577 [Ficus carica]|uniref:Uncharacterized protein n=1 Tax=Ficus carica TaxID=3494 RepID=A0AA88D4C7_FICCA|nr:hypothetical protein TIFTF001_011577 [Ficus carica]